MSRDRPVCADLDRSRHAGAGETHVGPIVEIPPGPLIRVVLGPDAPAGQESRRIRTIPGKGWFTDFRSYGPDKPAFDGGWATSSRSTEPSRNVEG